MLLQDVVEASRRWCSCNDSNSNNIIMYRYLYKNKIRKCYSYSFTNIYYTKIIIEQYTSICALILYLMLLLLNVVSCREYGLFNHVDAEKWEKGRENWIKLDQLNLTCFSKSSFDIPFLFSKKTLFISPIQIVHRHLDIFDHQDQSNFLQKDILRLKYWFNYLDQLYLYLLSR